MAITAKLFSPTPCDGRLIVKVWLSFIFSFCNWSGQLKLSQSLCSIQSFLLNPTSYRAQCPERHCVEEPISSEGLPLGTFDNDCEQLEEHNIAISWVREHVAKWPIDSQSCKAVPDDDGRGWHVTVADRGGGCHTQRPKINYFELKAKLGRTNNQWHDLANLSIKYIR